MCWRTREHADKHSQDCMGVTLGSGSTGCVTSRARPSSLHAARANGQQPSAATISLPRMGADHLLTDLLGELASPTCSKVGHHWDRCGAYFVEPIDEIEARGQEDWRR